MPAFEPVDIVLVTWNRPDLTEKVLWGLKNNTKRENYRLIVVDNGSEQETRDLIDKFQKMGIVDAIVACPTNLGLEPARNAGLSIVQNQKYFICMDNDCVPPPMHHVQAVDKNNTPLLGMGYDIDWVQGLVSLMEANPEYAAISCRTQVMIGTGNIFEEADEDESQDIVEFPHPGGSLRIMLTQPTREVGGWRDEPGRGAEERYICGQLRDKGWKTGFSVNIRTLHLFGDRTKGTDRWGYPEDWKPEDTGHSDIWHPALENGDDPEEVKQWVGKME